MGNSALREYWYHWRRTVPAPAGLSPPNYAIAWMDASPETQLLFLRSERCGPQDDLMVLVVFSILGLPRKQVLPVNENKSV